MRYGSVCSGIEAATAAWHDLGWKPSFFSEIEAFPRAVLKHHYPNTPLHGDFTTITGNEYDPIDLLVGGTPCQSFSVAGLRGGLADDRGNLALEFLRLADRTRPRWLVWENVPGVLSSNGGRDFGSIVGGMVQLGYGVAYRVLDAQYFGVAQRRRRVFVVGYLGDWRRAAAVLFERHSLQGHPPPRREKGQRVAPTIAGCANGGGANGPGRDVDSAESLIPTVSYALNAGGMNRQDYETETFVAFHAEAQADQLPSAGRDTGISDSLTTSQHAAVAFGGDIARTLSARYDSSPCADRGMDVVAVATPINMQMARRGPDTSNTPREGVGLGTPGDPSFTLLGAHAHAVQIAAHVRRLTPRECERLQGFPDDYTAIPWRGKPVSDCPDGPRYKALGNSMAVPVMRWIGQRIQMVEALPLKD